MAPNRRAEAQAALVRAREMRTQVLGAKHPLTLETEQVLVALKK